MNTSSENDTLIKLPKLDTVIKVVPAMLIFFGFIYLHSYYSYFDINIIGILDINEIVISFFPVLHFFLLIILVLIPLLLFFFLFANIDSNNPVLDLRIRINRIGKLNRAVSLLWSSNSHRLKILKIGIGNFYHLFVNKTTILAVLTIITYKTEEINHSAREIICIFFGMLLLDDFLMLIFEERVLHDLYHRLNYSSLRTNIHIVVFCILLFGWLRNSSTSIAKDSLSSNKYVKFDYEGRTISSNDTLKLIINNNKYLIIRDTVSDRNYYYRREKLTNLVIGRE